MSNTDANLSDCILNKCYNGRKRCREDGSLTMRTPTRRNRNTTHRLEEPAKHIGPTNDNEEENEGGQEEKAQEKAPPT